MALFKRADLKNKGLTDEQIEYVMTESGRALSSDYALKSDLQAQIDAAVEAAKGKAPEPVNVSETDEYKALLAENDKLKAFNTSDFGIVKDPYKDIVWGKLDHAEKHKPYAEQLTELSETMPDLFKATEAPEDKPATPQFGAGTKGTMPTGKAADSFGDIWGFAPKK